MGQIRREGNKFVVGEGAIGRPQFRYLRHLWRVAIRDGVGQPPGHQSSPFRGQIADQTLGLFGGELAEHSLQHGGPLSLGALCAIRVFDSGSIGVRRDFRPRHPPRCGAGRHPCRRQLAPSDEFHHRSVGQRQKPSDIFQAQEFVVHVGQIRGSFDNISSPGVRYLAEKGAYSS